MSETFSESFGGSGLLEQLNPSARVVGHRKDLVEIDLWLHAVALEDALEPRPGVERLGVLDAIPLVHAAHPAAFAPNKLLAEYPLHLVEVGCDLLKVLSARGLVATLRQIVVNDCRCS